MRMLLAALMRYENAICFRVHGQTTCLRKKAVIGYLRMLHGTLGSHWSYAHVAWRTHVVFLMLWCKGSHWLYAHVAWRTHVVFLMRCARAENLMDYWRSRTWNRFV